MPLITEDDLAPQEQPKSQGKPGVISEFGNTLKWFASGQGFKDVAATNKVFEEEEKKKKDKQNIIQNAFQALQTKALKIWLQTGVFMTKLKYDFMGTLMLGDGRTWEETNKELVDEIEALGGWSVAGLQVAPEALADLLHFASYAKAFDWTKAGLGLIGKLPVAGKAIDSIKASKLIQATIGANTKTARIVRDISKQIGVGAVVGAELALPGAISDHDWEMGAKKIRDNAVAWGLMAGGLEGIHQVDKAILFRSAYAAMNQRVNTNLATVTEMLQKAHMNPYEADRVLARMNVVRMLEEGVGRTPKSIGELESYIKDLKVRSPNVIKKTPPADRAFAQETIAEHIAAGEAAIRQYQTATVDITGKTSKGIKAEREAFDKVIADLYIQAGYFSKAGAGFPKSVAELEVIKNDMADYAENIRKVNKEILEQVYYGKRSNNPFVSAKVTPDDMADGVYPKTAWYNSVAIKHKGADLRNEARSVIPLSYPEASTAETYRDQVNMIIIRTMDFLRKGNPNRKITKDDISQEMVDEVAKVQTEVCETFASEYSEALRKMSGKQLGNALAEIMQKSMFFSSADMDAVDKATRGIRVPKPKSGEPVYALAVKTTKGIVIQNTDANFYSELLDKAGLAPTDIAEGGFTKNGIFEPAAMPDLEIDRLAAEHYRKQFPEGFGPSVAGGPALTPETKGKIPQKVDLISRITQIIEDARKVKVLASLQNQIKFAKGGKFPEETKKVIDSVLGEVNVLKYSTRDLRTAVERLSNPNVVNSPYYTHDEYAKDMAIFQAFDKPRLVDLNSTDLQVLSDTLGQALTRATEHAQRIAKERSDAIVKTSTSIIGSVTRGKGVDLDNPISLGPKSRLGKMVFSYGNILQNDLAALLNIASWKDPYIGVAISRLLDGRVATDTSYMMSRDYAQTMARATGIPPLMIEQYVKSPLVIKLHERGIEFKATAANLEAFRQTLKDPQNWAHFLEKVTSGKPNVFFAGQKKGVNIQPTDLEEIFSYIPGHLQHFGDYMVSYINGPLIDSVNVHYMETYGYPLSLRRDFYPRRFYQEEIPAVPVDYLHWYITKQRVNTPSIFKHRGAGSDKPFYIGDIFSDYHYIAASDAAVIGTKKPIEDLLSIFSYKNRDLVNAIDANVYGGKQFLDEIRYRLRVHGGLEPARSNDAALDLFKSMSPNLHIGALGAKPHLPILQAAGSLGPLFLDGVNPKDWLTALNPLIYTPAMTLRIARNVSAINGTIASRLSNAGVGVITPDPDSFSSTEKFYGYGPEDDTTLALFRYVDLATIAQSCLNLAHVQGVKDGLVGRELWQYVAMHGLRYIAATQPINDPTYMSGFAIRANKNIWFAMMSFLSGQQARNTTRGYEGLYALSREGNLGKFLKLFGGFVIIAGGIYWMTSKAFQSVYRREGIPSPIPGLPEGGMLLTDKNLPQKEVTWADFAENSLRATTSQLVGIGPILDYSIQQAARAMKDEPLTDPSRMQTPGNALVGPAFDLIRGIGLTIQALRENIDNEMYDKVPFKDQKKASYDAIEAMKKIGSAYGMLTGKPIPGMLQVGQSVIPSVQKDTVYYAKMIKDAVKNKNTDRYIHAVWQYLTSYASPGALTLEEQARMRAKGESIVYGKGATEGVSRLTDYLKGLLLDDKISAESKEWLRKMAPILNQKNMGEQNEDQTNGVRNP